MSYKTAFLIVFIFTVFIICILVLLQKHFETNRVNYQFLRPYRPSLHHNNKLIHLDTLINKYAINSDCNATFLAWIVTSYAGDPAPRSALRRAYTNEELQELGIKRVFLLGKLTDTAQQKTGVSQNALLHESQKFNDILQGDFLENYRNLTYKHLMGLSWALDNCVSAQYIMKMDDDIVVNLYDMIHALQETSIDNNTIVGYVMRNMIPVREPANKWFVSKEEFEPSVYPEFLSGWLYITRPWVARRLVRYSQFQEKYFWIDDVFITGILREHLSIKTQGLNKFYATDYRYLNCCINGKDKRLKCEFMVGPNGGDAELQVRFSDFGKFCQTECSFRAKHNSIKNTCVAAYDIPNLKGGIAQVEPILIL